MQDFHEWQSGRKLPQFGLGDVPSSNDVEDHGRLTAELTAVLLTQFRNPFLKWVSELAEKNRHAELEGLVSQIRGWSADDRPDVPGGTSGVSWQRDDVVTPAADTAAGSATHSY